ncbi:siderophore ABC transporter substrate-binding protein|uniref:Iron complex transport system substrate-binding protein n=1 Tax=Dendrosporobacter quercicolus TaxID=146817 RepID=A0A1G9NEY1_9FIRM|nr:siderophore ABC transporter substrate-binding protein [Dendrosporobacter quercicolus]NSL47320.1 siderophore ABC transporter substrate-binding protein [Dendrosporobacter quercicolus DSM 1736]SDL85118.1 iron complex transport system substrate-binding protein [Dendrosporobacter quercicolus]
MKKRLASWVAAATLAITLTGCATSGATPGQASAATSIKVTHNLGETEVPLNPRRVVVFDFSMLDTMDALGVAPILALPKNYAPAYLAKYKGDAYADVGDFYGKDLETINNFKPDLIILGGRQAKAYEEMQKIAPTIVMSVADSTNYMKELSRNNLIMGEIFAKKAEAQAALDKISARVKELRAVAEKNDSRALIVMVNDGNLSAYGPGSRFGLIHDVLGIKPVDPMIKPVRLGAEVDPIITKAGLNGMKIGFEYLEAKNPDMLFVIDRTVVVGGSQKAASTLDNALVRATNAAKNGKIIFLDPGTWYSSGNGLESSSMMIEEIAAVLGI